MSDLRVFPSWSTSNVVSFSELSDYDLAGRVVEGRAPGVVVSLRAYQRRQDSERIWVVVDERVEAAPPEDLIPFRRVKAIELVNVLIENALGERRLFVAEGAAPTLVGELESCQYDEDGGSKIGRWTTALIHGLHKSGASLRNR